jgi:hypothetical protein
MAFMRPATPAQTAPQALDELGGIQEASAAGAKPDDAFSESDLLAGNAGFGPDEVCEPEGRRAPRRAAQAAGR